MSNTLRKTALAAAVVLSLAVAACNTVSGAGKDVSSAGDAVTKSAEENK